MSVTFSPSAATTTASTVPRMPPSVVTYRYQHATGSEMAYVALAGSHEEAQNIAWHAFPAHLATVDPSWLVFTITIRYKSSNERQEISIAPRAWTYVTSRLVPYRLIDVRVVPPTPAPSPTKTAAPSYTDQHRASMYNDKSQAHAPPQYPDTPPPQYPGSPRKQHKELHPHLPPNSGYGYGFGWHDQTQGHGADYNATLPDPDESADRRSQGWSASSVRVGRNGSWGGGFFTRMKSNGFGIFPITWNDESAERRRRRAKRRHGRTKMQEHAHDEYEHGTGSGSRPYVPSLL